MDKKVIKVYKKRGETPLECINSLKKEEESLKLLPMTYAGRLDPLAEGLLLILVGDECHKKNEYMNLPKIYEVDVLFGFSTDTYDLMGKIVKSSALDGSVVDHGNKEANEFLKKQAIPNISIGSVVKNTVSSFTGNINQSYPPYSSRPVRGKPLFMWAREDKLNEIEIPVHDVFIENIEIVEEKKISGKDLLVKIKEDISLVKGDFRQKEIVPLWNVTLRGKDEEKFDVVKIRVSCGTGVYMRSIANDIGKKLGIPALAMNIKRVKVGDYEIE